MNERSDDVNLAGNGRRRRVLGGLAVIVGLLALAALAWWLLFARGTATTDNAYVSGNVVQITAAVGGTVTAVRADDTQFVRAGQILVELDDADARIALQTAEANLAEVVRNVRGLYAGADQSAAVVEQRRADVDRARQDAARADAELARIKADFTRKEALWRKNFISAEALQMVQTEVRSAEAAASASRAAIAQATAAVDAAREQKTGALGRVDHTTLEAHPQVIAAAARVREAALALSRARVVAPVDGYVARRKVQLGERIAAGNPLMAVIPADQLWVDANFKETDLEDVRIGQPVTLSADFWGDGTQYHGRVLGLAAGTGASFAVLPAQNASGNWIKIVQRVPVRISLDPAELQARPLRVGLSMRARVDTRDSSGALLSPAADPAGGIATDVFAAQGREADALIERIIAGNRGATAPEKMPRAPVDRKDGKA